MKRAQSKVNFNSDIIDELKRAMVINDEELLEDVMMEKPSLARYMFDKDSQSYVIHKAAQSDNHKMIEVLLKYGADINQKDGQKMTPLMIAA